MAGILITGGTGSFGNAFVPLILKTYNVQRVVIYSRDELKQAEMERRFDDPRLRFYLGDVRDLERLEMAMDQITHIVHAAALKRIEKCEIDPLEAVKTNVMGTSNVIHSALRSSPFSILSPGHMVGLSTDKACNPANLYGASKLCMERLILAANNLAGGRARFSVLRYGNIFGSRGSVFDIWSRIAAASQSKVVVTDPAATRFFLRINQATHAVKELLFNPPNCPVGEERVHWFSDMPAYRLGDLMEAMGLTAGKTVGLGRHEKLHEEIMPGMSSADARRMTVDEIRAEIKDWEKFGDRP